MKYKIGDTVIAKAKAGVMVRAADGTTSSDPEFKFIIIGTRNDTDLGADGVPRSYLCTIEAKNTGWIGSTFSQWERFDLLEKPEAFATKRVVGICESYIIRRVKTKCVKCIN